MIVRYSCKGMGINCTFVSIGKTVEVVTQVAFDHVHEMHADEFNVWDTAAQIAVLKISLSRSMWVGTS